MTDKRAPPVHDDRARGVDTVRGFGRGRRGRGRRIPVDRVAHQRHALRLRGDVCRRPGPVRRRFRPAARGRGRGTGPVGRGRRALRLPGGRRHVPGYAVLRGARLGAGRRLPRRPRRGRHGTCAPPVRRGVRACSALIIRPISSSYVLTFIGDSPNVGKHAGRSKFESNVE